MMITIPAWIPVSGFGMEQTLLGDTHTDLREIRPAFLFSLAMHADRLVVVNGKNTGVLFLE
jgi:hypothetical protein